ncbi:MAG: electron transport complex subunit RsxE, partial [Gemmatimonadales bacterium]
ENALWMALATFFVLTGSSLMVSLLKKLIPGEVRIPMFILIIATFVTVADMCLEAIVPAVYKQLGAFVALIVVNCIILSRQEAFASKRPIGRSLLDAVGTGVGFTIAMVMMGSVREVLGQGTLMNYKVIPGNFEPWVIFILPPGGFLTLGFWLLILNWWEERKKERARVREWPEGVGAPGERRVA